MLFLTPPFEHTHTHQHIHSPCARLIVSVVVSEMDREDALVTAFCHKAHVGFSSHAENFYTSKHCLFSPSRYHMGTARNLENRHLFGENRRVACIVMWPTGVSLCDLFLVGNLTPSISANPGAHRLLWNHAQLH